MSTVEPEIYDEHDEPDDSPVIKQLRKQARDQANELKMLREQAEQSAQLAKENALFKANLGNLNDAQQKAVLTMSTEATAEALRAQAEALGFVELAAPAAPAEELAAHDRIANAATGGATPDAASYEAELVAARSEQEVIEVMKRYGYEDRALD